MVTRNSRGVGDNGEGIALVTAEVFVVNRALSLGQVLIIVSLLGASAWAVVHPVPLDPKQDSATCLQCHEDRTKGKSVHSAIAMGCTSCHEIRVNKNTTRVKLINTTSVALCVTCHADKKAADITKGKVHPPAVRDCVKCHEPHQSDNKNQLLKPVSGETADQNLCLSCHKTGVNVPKEGSRHAALDMGCDTCHVTHKTGERGKREFDFHLTKDAPALCIDCHDPKDATLIKAHQGQPLASADCLTCHDPHQSANKKLMNKFMHSPFAGGQCDSCHQAPKDGKVVLTAATAKEVCLTCHADKGEEIEKSKVQHPGAAGDCTDCHNPHAGNSPGFQKPNAVAVCLTCHADQAAQGQKAVVHQPAFEQGCFVCHEPHGSKNEHLLRSGNWNTLCMECHGPDAQPAKLEGEHLVTIFDGKVKLPEDYFRRIDPLPVKYGLGHPVERHPVKDIVDPESGKLIRAVNCSTCHQPHSSSHAGLLVGDQENNTEFCATCHKAVK
jgi:predicted CXXCH cytochrome family protein